MVDMNMMIAGNILAILKQQNKKQVDLADALHTNKQTVNKMLNGARMINAVELKQIADFLGVKMEELTKIRGNDINTSDMADMDIAHAFMGKVESRQAKNALEIADKLSDMILFHSRVRENGVDMMEAWDC
jgi:transcriptional regulator with XRE-family HTH domain